MSKRLRFVVCNDNNSNVPEKKPPVKRGLKWQLTS